MELHLVKDEELLNELRRRNKFVITFDIEDVRFQAHEDGTKLTTMQPGK